MLALKADESEPPSGIQYEEHPSVLREKFKGSSAFLSSLAWWQREGQIYSSKEIKILALNCRGASRNAFEAHCRLLVRTHDFSIIQTTYREKMEFLHIGFKAEAHLWSGMELRCY